MTYPLKSNTSESYESHNESSTPNAPKNESRNVIYASLRPQRAMVRPETSSSPFEGRDVVRSGEGATIRVMAPESVSERLIPFPINHQNPRRPEKTNRLSYAQNQGKTPYFSPSLKPENPERIRFDDYKAPAPLASPHHVTTQKQRHVEYSQKEVVLVMSKLSLASMVLGLMVMGSLCFAVGFLSAVTLYNKNETPAQTSTQFWMAQQSPHHAHQAYPQPSSQQGTQQAQPHYKQANQQQASQNTAGQHPTYYGPQGYPASGPQQEASYNPSGPNAVMGAGSMAGYEPYRASQGPSQYVPAPLRPFAAYAARSASHDPAQGTQESFKHTAQAAAPNPFQQQPGYAAGMAGSYPAPIRAYGYPPAPQQAPYRP